MAGISPDDAERLLVRPLETALKSMASLKEMKSAGFEGGGYVLLEFEAGFDPDVALQDVRAKVDTLSHNVRVEPRFLLQRPTDLSGGQKQRIAIARAFAGDPTLVICDEPASALDVSVQASILNLLVELQTKERVSYVFISHDLAVVRYISDRIGVMYLAELIEVGAAEEVFNPPHHPYTEALLSSIPKLDFDTVQQRIALRGSMPSLSDPPSGCRFHTRCHRLLGEICEQQEPPIQKTGDGHTYKCHIPPDELLALQVKDEAPTPASTP
jgi:peptide/nickel transport system ATP-binding protein